MEEVHAGTSRVRVTAATVHIGEHAIDRDTLSTWKGWDRVTALAKKIEPPLTPEELGVLGTTATGAGKNGYREMLSFLSTCRAVS